MIKVYYFSAEWCGPCKAFGPMITDLTNGLTGVELEKVDADDKPELVNKFQVKSFPSIVMVKGEQELGRHSGLVPKSKLQQVLNNAINQ
jgi:thioredoxin 1